MLHRSLLISVPLIHKRDAEVLYLPVDICGKMMLANLNPCCMIGMVSIADDDACSLPHVS